MSKWVRLPCAFLPVAVVLGTYASALAAPSSQAGDGHAFSARLLLAQNVERRRLGLSPLEWDPQLEASASTYADKLATTGDWQHSPRVSRRGQGENLWMGTKGNFTAEEMIGGWVSEKTKFRAGIFPNVSSTGHWEDVGHYTQVIWATTDRIGCSLRSSPRYDYLVCRYAQAGNVMGQSVMPTRLATAD
jgi:hypothetical protein